MFASKVGDGLDIRCELARQPHQLDVAARLVLQASARLNLIQIAVDVELEQRRRMIAWPTRRSGVGKPQRRQIQFVDERIDNAHGAVFRSVIVHAGRQKKLLPAVTPLDETTYPTSPDDVGKHSLTRRFYTASVIGVRSL